MTFRLSTDAAGTIVSLEQDNNPGEPSRDHSAANWQAMLTTLKKLPEDPAA